MKQSMKELTLILSNSPSGSESASVGVWCDEAKVAASEKPLIENLNLLCLYVRARCLIMWCTSRFIVGTLSIYILSSGDPEKSGCKSGSFFRN